MYRPYKHTINEKIITNKGEITILDCIKVLDSRGFNSKAYKYQCNLCGYTGTILESNLQKGCGCLVCGGRTGRGINDIYTLHPELVSYFYNEEDAHKYSIKSNLRADFKCSICGDKIPNKIICSMTKSVPICTKCSDSISMPEKMIISLLELLNVNYIHQKSFSWGNNKKYDFYLPDYNCIIETHGEQHFRISSFNGRCTENDQYLNDEFKKQNAIKNGIKTYVELICIKTDFKSMRDEIIYSELNRLFYLDDIDWIQWEKDSMKSIMKKCCDLWNQGMKSTFKIKKETGLGVTTIRSYLKRGAEIGLCDYNPELARSHKNK